MRPVQLALVAALFPAMLAAQDASSIADAAKSTKSPQKAKSKIVITDDNFQSSLGPFPDMAMEGVDNSDLIFKSISEYRKTHTPAETEMAIRDWYTRYDEMFQHAFAQNTEIKERAQDRYTDPRPYSDDYKKYQEQRSTEMRSQIQDGRVVEKNNFLIARIQQTMTKLRNLLQMNGMRYDWMKIRYGNGNGSY